ncbi:MAG TPA: FmdB family zinc ribbon protein [Anaerolineales bacterium]|nr:FmdB family zinc ribbon protein [Anaerolineales bacterium]
MPTYEYRCLDCRKRVSLILSYSEYGKAPVVCPHCGSANLKRRIGRVRLLRSEDSRLDSLADPDDWGDVDENDPRSVARAMRRMGDEMGEELPDEFDEVVDRLESGEDPEAIEKDLPDLGGGDDGGGDDFDF